MRKFHKFVLPLIVLVLAASVSFAQEDGKKTSRNQALTAISTLTEMLDLPIFMVTCTQNMF